MTISQADLDSFNDFAQTKLKSGEADTMAELFDLWLLENPSDAEQADVIGAIKEGLADVAAARVYDFDEVNSEIFRRHGWPTE